MAHQIGSFRGLRFRTRGHTLTVGPRVGVYEIPFDSLGVASVPLGRKPRVFKIDCFLFNTNTEALAAEKQAFIQALETEGPGLLVHPDLPGTFSALIHQAVDVTESQESLNVVDIGFIAIEHRDREQPSPAEVSLGTKAAVVSASNNLGTAIGDAMETDVSVDGVADFVANANVTVLELVIDDLIAMNNDINSVLSIPGNLTGQIEQISLQLADLLQTPRKLYDTISGAIDEIARSINRIAPGGANDSIGSLKRAVAASSDLGSTAAPVPLVDTPSRLRQRQNQGAILIGFRAEAIRRMAESVVSMQYDSANSARDMGRRFVGAVESVLLDPVEDQEPAPSVRRGLIKLRTAISQHMAAKAGTLVELTTYTPPETLPVSVIAWTLYGDATRADEIVARNPDLISHPGFCRGGIPLEVAAV